MLPRPASRVPLSLTGQGESGPVRTWFRALGRPDKCGFWHSISGQTLRAKREKCPTGSGAPEATALLPRSRSREEVQGECPELVDGRVHPARRVVLERACRG